MKNEREGEEYREKKDEQLAKMKQVEWSDRMTWNGVKKCRIYCVK